MGDECFFDISPLQPSRIRTDTAPWLTQVSQHQPNTRPNIIQGQQTISQISDININGGEVQGVMRENARENVSFSARPAQHFQANGENTDNMATWNPMDDDFSCPTFNSYKNFDVLTAEQPGERSPEKSIRQSPEKRTEDISLYVGNIPLAINQDGLKNLFLTVGEVQSCKILPPKDPSYDTRYGFVRFGTWREAIKAIETFSGLYVGSEKKLHVRVAHKKRNGSDFFTRDEEYSSSDGTDPFVNNSSFKSVNEDTLNQNSNASPELPTEDNQTNSEQKSTTGKLPNDVSKPSPATPRAELPCTCCEKLCRQRCSACKSPYCSRDCQKMDRARHKLVCTFPGKTNTPKPASPSPTPAQVTEQEPQRDPASDSDFDCIDISMDTSHRPSKETSKEETKNTMTFPDGNEDIVNTMSNAPGYEELNFGTRKVMSQDQSLPTVLPGGHTWLDKEFITYVTAVTAANTFWAVVRAPDYPRFHELTTQMAGIREEHLEKLAIPNLGSFCLARFSLDNFWYRSRITQGNAEQVEVTFVDYGNTEWKNIHDLYQLPPGFVDVPPQAQQFILNGVTLTSDSELEQRMVEYLNSLVTGKTFLAELVSSAPGCIPEVIIRDDEKSINQQMVNYQEQQTAYTIGSQKGLDQSRFCRRNMGMDQQELSETKPRQEFFQQAPVNESYYPAEDHSIGNRSAIGSMTYGYGADYTSVNEPMISYASDNVSTNDPISYNVPPNEHMTGVLSDNTPHNYPMGSLYRSDNCLDNDPMASFVADYSPDNELMASYVSDDIPPNDKMTGFLSDNTSHDNPMGGSFPADNIPPNDPMTNFVPDKNLVRPFSNVGLKRYMALDVPTDVLPFTRTFDILVCHFLTPSLFWIWFLDTAREHFNRLSSMMSATYEQSTYLDYQPLTGELIAAKFTDGVWYRAAVDSFNYDGTLKVTFIDFGNSENVSVLDIRSITGALAAIPRLATQCALHDMEEPTRKWSTECIQFCNNLMLNKCGSAILEINKVHPGSLVLRIDMDINGKMGSVVEEIIKQGYFISEKLQIQDFVGHGIPTCTLLEQTSSNKKPDFLDNRSLLADRKPALPATQAVSPGNKPFSAGMQPPLLNREPVLTNNELVFLDNKPAVLLHQPAIPDNKPAFSTSRSSERHVSPNNQSVLPGNESNIANIAAGQPRAAGYPAITKPEQSVNTSDMKSGPQSPASKRPLSPVSRNSVSVPGQKVSQLPLPTVPTTAFNVIINDVLSADKFYAQMIDPQLVSQLHKCVRELNEFVKVNHPPKVDNATVGSLGCAKFSHDDVWYRAQVLQINEGNYRVRFIDFGNIQYVSPDEFLKAPEFFYQLAPQAICCHLGMNDHVWGEQSRNMMKKLTSNKEIRCSVVAGTSYPQYAVKLQHSVGDQLVDIAEELTKEMKIHPPVRTPHPSESKRQMGTFAEEVLKPAILASGIEKTGEKYDIFVSYVAHPTYFCAQHATPENIENIKRLQNVLSHHYNNNSYPPFKPEINSLCVCLVISRNAWYRVYVRSASPKGLLVYSVDFGFLRLVEERVLRPLEEKFRSPPFGAMLFSMQNIKPLDGKIWTDETKKYFRKKVYSRVVKIRLCVKRCRLFVDVYDPDSSEECLLSSTLIAGGMAKEFHETSDSPSRATENVAFLEESLHTPPSLPKEPGSCNHQAFRAYDVPNTSVEVPFAGDDSNRRRGISSPVQFKEDTSLQYQVFKSSDQQGMPTSVARHGDISTPRGKCHYQVPGFNSHPEVPARDKVPGLSPYQNSVSSTNVTHVSPDVRDIPSNNNNVEQTGPYQIQSPSSCSYQNPGLTGGATESGNLRAARCSSSIPVVIPNENELRVFVWWVDSPDSFWVQHVVEETARLNAVMAEQLDTLYESSSENVQNASVGDFCCSNFAGEWCRCKVEALLGNGLARVFYVDFGNRQDIELVKLKPLSEEFRVLPAHVLQCALADVRARAGGWAPQSVEWLKGRILNKTLVAAVVRRVDNVLHVRLYDSLDFDRNVSINSLMVQSGI